MKLIKIIIISYTIVLSAHTIKAQDYMQLKTYQDTANYLIHEFDMKKDKYVGKTFTSLLKDLRVKPKDILVGGWNGELINKNNFRIYMYVFMNDGKEFEDKHYIVVHFKNVPTDFDTLNALCFQSERIDLNKVFDLYKNTVVTRISVKDYTQNEPLRPGISENSR